MHKIDDLIKHDKYVERLCEQIDPHYDLIFKHVPLFTRRRSSRKKRMVGEIDILAFKDDYYDIYEVKCSHRITKARKQLSRIQKSLKMDRQLRNAYFFCGESGQLEALRQKGLKSQEHSHP